MIFHEISRGNGGVPFADCGLFMPRKIETTIGDLCWIAGWVYQEVGLLPNAGWKSGNAHNTNKHIPL